jgi:hypothetical protein
MGDESTEQHVKLIRSINDWVKRIGLQDKRVAGDVAVDLADLLRAASEARGLLERLLTTDLDAEGGREEALEAAVEIEVWLFHEVKPHLEDLERNWERVLEQLDRDS